MKNLKIVLATLLIAVGGITLSSFTLGSFKKNAFATECWLYIGPNSTSVPIHPTPTDIRNYSSGSMTDNWVLSSQMEVSKNCGDVPFLCAICFNNEGGFDIEDAIDAVADAVEADNDDNFYDVFTSSGQIVGGVTVHLKD